MGKDTQCKKPLFELLRQVCYTQILLAYFSFNPTHRMGETGWKFVRRKRSGGEVGKSNLSGTGAEERGIPVVLFVLFIPTVQQLNISRSNYQMNCCCFFVPVVLFVLLIPASFRSKSQIICSRYSWSMFIFILKIYLNPIDRDSEHEHFLWIHSQYLVKYHLRFDPLYTYEWESIEDRTFLLCQLKQNVFSWTLQRINFDLRPRWSLSLFKNKI